MLAVQAGISWTVVVVISCMLNDGFAMQTHNFYNCLNCAGWIILDCCDGHQLRAN